MQELRQWILQQMETASSLYETKGLERVRLEGEYAAFNAVAEKLVELEPETNATDKQPRRSKKTPK